MYIFNYKMFHQDQLVFCLHKTHFKPRWRTNILEGALKQFLPNKAFQLHLKETDGENSLTFVFCRTVLLTCSKRNELILGLLTSKCSSKNASLWYHHFPTLLVGTTSIGGDKWTKATQIEWMNALPPPRNHCKNEHVNGSRVKAEDFSVWA